MASLRPRRKLRQLRDRVEQLEAQNARYSQSWPPGHFYSPIPSVDEVRQDEARIFRVPSELPGISLEQDRQLALLDELAPYCDDQPFDDERRPGLRYFFQNDYFMHGDALVLHALIRRLRPKRIVEIGSGYSSAVMLDTNERFLDGAVACTFIEPEPDRLLELLRPPDLEDVRLVESRVQDVGSDLFSELEPGDVLFVDSSHVAKAGSDVNMIVFEILPRLSPGVHVHFHDVYYPFEYPAEWIYGGRAWNEAYLLRSFLEYNRAFEIVLFNSYLASCHRSAWLARLPLAARSAASSLWLRRVVETGG